MIETIQIIATIAHACAFFLWLIGFVKMISMTRDKETQAEIDYALRRWGEELHKNVELIEQNIRLKIELDKIRGNRGKNETRDY